MDFPSFLTTIARCSARASVLAAVLALSAHLLATAPGALQSSGSPQSASAVTPHAAQQADPALVPFRNPTELDGFVTPAAVTSLIATFELSAAESAIAWELFRGYAAKVDILDREAVKAIDEGGRHELNQLWDSRATLGITGAEPPGPEFMHQSDIHHAASMRIAVDYVLRGDGLATEFLADFHSATSVRRDNFEAIARDAILFEAYRITNARSERSNGDERTNVFTDGLRLLEGAEREEILDCLTILNSVPAHAECAEQLRVAISTAAMEYRTALIEFARAEAASRRKKPPTDFSSRGEDNPTAVRRIRRMQTDRSAAAVRLFIAVEAALQDVGCESLSRVWRQRAWGAFAQTAYRKPLAALDLARWVQEQTAMPEDVRQAILQSDAACVVELDALHFEAAQRAHAAAADWGADDGARTTDLAYAKALAAVWKLRVVHIQRTLAFLPAPFRAELRKELGEEPPFHFTRFAVFDQPTRDWLIERRILPAHEKWN